MNNDKVQRVAVKQKRLILPLLAIGILALPIYKLVLVDRLGFCPSRLRFTSSNELILKQIDVLMKSGLMKLDPADSSAAAYLARHPKCCRVSWGQEQPFDRGLTSFGSATITVIYELSEKGTQYYRSSGTKETYYEDVVDYTACGRALREIGSTMMPPVARPKN